MLLVQKQMEQPHRIEHSEADPGTSIYVNVGLQINEKNINYLEDGLGETRLV